MDKELIEKYKRELMEMYRASPAAKFAMAAKEEEEKKPFPPDDGSGEQQGVYDRGTPPLGDDASDSNGRLAVMVTAISDIYPVPKAVVTVFTGPYETMETVDRGITDESGKTKVFELAAPPRGLSLDENPGASPFSLYNIMIEADGYVTNVHTNVPIFRGVTSLQRSNLLPLSASADGNGPIFYDESTGFGL